MAARKKHVKKVRAPLSDKMVQESLYARWGASQFSPAMIQAEREAIASRRQRRRPPKQSRQLLPGDYD